jgi:DNA-binding CsgD family transcriptional regulator
VADENDSIYQQITLRRAEVLRELADGYTESEIAEHLGITVNGVRSHVGDLREITGCSGVRELGRWWRHNRHGWMRSRARVAGADSSTGPLDHSHDPGLP